MKNKNSALGAVAALAVGEIAVSAATVAIFALLGQFSYKVITGVLLGCFVSVFNFLFLTISVNSAVNKFVELRGDAEMSEEEAEKFAAEHAGGIQNAQKLSYLIRMFSMVGALVVAFITGQFNVLATVIPLLAFQPILLLSQLILQKKGG
ncbi:MAG: hypothetical protein IJW79_02595 [Clostridia bacterium]|nr:hypothetical protein [Clostridia bacterium]